MFKVIKYSIFTGVFLTLVGCGTKIEILPEIVEYSKDQHIIYAKFDSNKTYMKKYLPSNVIIKDDAPINVEYSFVNNATNYDIGGDAINIILPLGLFGIPTNSKSLQMGARLRFFNKDNELVLNSICSIDKPKNIYSGTNLTKLRKLCIPEIKQNLQNQINLKFNKGEFNAFK
jgi:hypothetical protein